jgi:hypothetical protein
MERLTHQYAPPLLRKRHAEIEVFYSGYLLHLQVLMCGEEESSVKDLPLPKDSQDMAIKLVSERLP